MGHFSYTIIKMFRSKSTHEVHRLASLSPSFGWDLVMMNLRRYSRFLRKIEYSIEFEYESKINGSITASQTIIPHRL